MRDVNEVIAQALDGLGCPATRTPAAGRDDVYLTWSVIRMTPDAYASNLPRRMAYLVQVDIYSRPHYAGLLTRVLWALQRAGFMLEGVAMEDYEEDTGYHHVPITARWAQPMSDDEED